MINEKDISVKTGRQKSTAKRQAIKDAAAHLFLTEGFGRTSMDAVASHAGVSKQTVYSHFPSKDDLFRHCILSKIRQYGLDMAEYSPASPLVDVLHDLGHRLLDLCDDDKVVSMHRVLIAETTAFPKLAHSFWETGPNAAMTALSDYMRENTAAGFSAIGDPDSAASDFMLLVEGHYLRRRMMQCAELLTDEQRLLKVRSAVDKVLRLHDERYQQ